MIAAPAAPLGVGLPLHADAGYLDLVGPLLTDAADFFEVTPELLLSWDGSALTLGGNASIALQAKAHTGKPVVAHGVGFSLGTPLVGAAELARSDAWLRGLAELHAHLGLDWYTEHLGFTVTPGGQDLTLPLALPHTTEAVSTVAARLHRLRDVVPLVGFENSVFYFLLGDALAEADFYNRIAEAADCALLLDLHNVHTHCRNFDIAEDDFIDRIDLSRVLELHLSGGRESDPAWLRDGQVRRLDSHDTVVPEAVWALYERVLPQCPHAAAVVVERMPGSLTTADVPAFADELARARSTWDAVAPLGGAQPC
jgi:uncharacterized protein (UPF0276 family)